MSAKECRSSLLFCCSAGIARLLRKHVGMGNILSTSACCAGAERHQESSDVHPDSLITQTGPAPAAKGNKLLHDYVLGEVLGQGAFGVVYECALKGTNAFDYAVKMVDKVETPVEEIKHEAELIQSLAHPNIVKFHAIYFEKVFVCIVMSKYPGGDMIEGMQDHWKTRGKIPCAKIGPIAQQMMESIAHLHNCKILHRDVKGDNYLMDRKDLVDPGTKIILSDFGTAVRAEPTERLSASVGTKIYWSPEFHNLEYGYKVDVWAIGVITFGLLDGRFPFKNEKDVRSKTIKIGGNATQDAKDFVLKLLDKSEASRLSSAQALKHPFIATLGAGVAAPPEQADPEWKAENVKEALDRGKDERRKELVERLEKAAVKNTQTTTQRLSNMWKPEFFLESPGRKTVSATNARQMKFSWVSDKAASDLGIVTTGPSPAATDDDENKRKAQEDALIKNLKDHRIDISAWGTGEAKTIKEFAQEVYSGAAQLMLDASSHKRLVRVVDIVLLRLSADDKFLVEASEVMADGRSRADLNRIPACKKLPYENSKRAAARLMAEQLGLDATLVTISPNREKFEEEEVSRSFPGVVTVYRKEIIEATVNNSVEAKTKLGLQPGGMLSFSKTEGSGASKSFVWMTESNCEVKRIKLRAPTEQLEVSALVQAPIGFREEELEAFLKENNVDVSKFTGTGNIKSLADFAGELIAGEATLQKGADGQVFRIVDVVAVKLVKEQTGELLIEAAEVLPNGSSNAINRLPGCKKRADENEFVSAHQLIEKKFRIEDDSFTFVESKVAVVEDKKESPSYPGIQTLYRKRIITAFLSHARL
eukprot:TRINITY_DN112062_c0_g1_i1.p1 TRINITY_DN112062_c0_g1~~TRINITY_DN112062_c0_g1_i1.p1  ORF type:complete len:819 (-),score=183.67 TRINITY_DN112062_c0_g1_i1:185-2641(-)